MILKILVSFLSLIALTTITYSPPGEILNLKTLDLFRRPHSPHPEIVILAIDNKSLESLGRWPWNREIHARIIDKLNGANPQILGLDITFSEVSDKKSDETLAASIRNAKYPIVLSSELIFFKGSQESQKTLLPLNLFLNNSDKTSGFTNLESDSDGLTRTLPESKSIRDTTYLPFSLQIATHLNSRVPTQDALVNIAGPSGSFPTYSISDLVSDKIPKENLSGKIILIGATAADLHDTVLTPTGVIAGVEWQANILDNLLLSRSISLLPKNLSFGLGLVFIFIVFIAFSRLSARNLSYFLAVSTLSFPILSFLLWQFNIALYYFSNLALGFILFFAHAIYRWYASEVEKRKIKQTFQPYFSPTVMEAILKDPTLLQLGGKSQEVTILFSDIRNFTTITESLPPETLTKLLQEYFTEVSEEILKTDGVIDKFIGDAVMAFWGAPIANENHADQAVQAAINMLKKLKKLQIKWQKEGLPFIDMGVGINTGVVTIGNMGSKTRFDYTLIGDSVNLASRLEGLNKEYKTHIIVSESTKNKLSFPIKLKNLGEVLVKGKTKPIKIYSV